MISSQPLNAMQIKLMIAVKSPSPALRWRTQSCEFARPYRQCLHRWRCSQRYSGCRYGCVSDACHAWHFARRINGACDRQNAFALVFPATCCRVAPVPNILRHRSTTSVVITRRRPPTLPCSLAAAKPARVRSTSSSRSISARALPLETAVTCYTSHHHLRLRCIAILCRKIILRISNSRVLMCCCRLWCN